VCLPPCGEKKTQRPSTPQAPCVCPLSVLANRGSWKEEHLFGFGGAQFFGGTSQREVFFCSALLAFRETTQEANSVARLQSVKQQRRAKLTKASAKQKRNLRMQVLRAVVFICDRN